MLVGVVQARGTNDGLGYDNAISQVLLNKVDGENVYELTLHYYAALPVINSVDHEFHAELEMKSLNGNNGHGSNFEFGACFQPSQAASVEYWDCVRVLANADPRISSTDPEYKRAFMIEDGRVLTDKLGNIS